MRSPLIVVMLCLTLLTLSGCRHSLFKKPPVNDPSTDATIQLAEAAVSISHSIHEMATVEKVISPINRRDSVNIPNILELQTRASIDWAGPIDELVHRIAKSVHFRFHVLGKHPAIPVLINLTARDETLVSILRNIDYQAANNASLRVYPHQRLIELRYANLY